jgi:hypothetical protein
MLQRSEQTSSARSAGTATKISFAPISTPAASGCNNGSIRLLALPLFTIFLAISGSLLLEPAAIERSVKGSQNGLLANHHGRQLALSERSLTLNAMIGQILPSHRLIH